LDIAVTGRKIGASRRGHPRRAHAFIRVSKIN
jgi:hypothetical protein